MRGKTPRLNPPEPEAEPPETVEVAVGWCFDCREVLGPNRSEVVGETVYYDHRGHKTELIDEWEEEVEAGE